MGVLAYQAQSPLRMTEERPLALSRPWFDEREAERVRAALAGKTAGDGPFCRRVEKRLEEQLGSPRVLLTTSCTHALELALLALGVGAGQEVILPVVHVRLDGERRASRRRAAGARRHRGPLARPRPGRRRAPPHRRAPPRSCRFTMPGIACEMTPLLELARRRGFKVVEDAAQGLGASLDGRALGSLGDAGGFSFHETKNLTCGEGGALALRDPAVAARAEIIREKGTNRSAFLRGEVDKYTWIAEGSSYVLSDVLAAILDAQLDKQAEIAARRRRIATRYREELGAWASAHGVRLPAQLPGRTVNDHIFYLLLPGRRRPGGLPRRPARARDRRRVPLRAAPLVALRGLARRRPGDFPVTERVASTLVRLPLHPLLEDARRGARDRRRPEQPRMSALTGARC